MGRSPTIVECDEEQTRPNVEEIWWGRVPLCELATPIFSNPGPRTNVLLLVTKEGVLRPTLVLLSLQLVSILR